MEVLFALLLLLALVCFLLAAFGVSARIDLTAAGLFCWVLVVFIQYARSAF